MKKLAGLFAASLVTVALTACNENDKTADSKATNAANQTVHLYTWTEYVPEGLLYEFTKQTGIKVEVSSLESNETMYAKLKLQGKDGGYDVIAPSNYFVSKMAKEGMLSELDHSQLPVIKDLNPDWLNKSYDQGNKYSLPQLLGAPGIAFNTADYQGEHFTAWADLWKPEFVNKVQLLDDAREVFNIALLKLGKNPNTTDPAEIKEAYEELKKLRPNVLSFNSDNPANAFISGEVSVGQLWNGSVRIAKKEQAPIDMVFPKEGPVLWVDTLAIPANSKNKENAHKLINYLLSAPVAEKLTLAIGYPTSNIEALKVLPKEITQDPAIYPTAEVLQKSQWQDDVGDAIELYEKYYQELKAAK
ncbi:spermidine/putrescine ABC transporter substrate-binding protein [[Haemophilus] ducreyi]|uniref:Putrescine-binding periplasmic protein n=1 Tax=Haemophilus ducreyi TaxID=730 RepID=A0AAC8UCP2_HAEDC|nr:extracellular solute-binding protein [[Haemophilus] ducreyi]AKO30948.1 spermidine/putrescine ABC transporter substrate-binding protein [[Haemophilus] ducreyi]AKO32387.1 spermidine/putrescine ABC transporter substrate-binding protein [[Haemophilus] ducreyi]AKO33839.1 spermidine/putrescine ABC transporter substrate-binding protein [[Haemophilus] ducreyi]AKO35285.1 spermidine/putrescine ABC transporter substrate-binding protein [[Haemophilus] ducreyi]AKO44060.1 spermidine/putrescine ABC transp